MNEPDLSPQAAPRPELRWHPLANAWIVHGWVQGKPAQRRFPATSLRARQEAEDFLARLLSVLT